MASKREREAASDHPPVTAEAPTAEAPSSPAAEAPAEDSVVVVKGSPADDEELMPEVSQRGDARAVNLLLDACGTFNLDPRLDTRPRELLSWRFYPGDRVDGTLDRVTLVTAGGLKLTLLADGSLDADTEERVRALFRAFTIDSVTKQMVPTALPADLSLPEAAVLGHVTSTTHRHPQGYLRRPRGDA